MNPITVLKEFSHEIRKSKTLAKSARMTFFNHSLSGQGYMIDSYAKADPNRMIAALKQEVDFVLDQKKKSNLSLVDVGANLGLYAIAYSMTGDVSVMAFEPFPDTFKHLQSNVESNKIKNVKFFNFGLFSSDKKMRIGTPNAFSFYSLFQRIVKFTDKNQSGCMSVFTQDTKSPEVQFYAGDTCPEIQSLDSIDFIKIDVEGSEFEVVKGLRNSIKKFHPLLKIEFNGMAFKAANVNPSELMEYIISLGYTQYSSQSQNGQLSWEKIEPTRVFKGSPDILFY